MSNNAADPDEVKKKGKEDKLASGIEVSDLRFILSTQQGRRFIWRYLTHAGIFTTSFTGNSTTFFNEGKRDIGLKLLAEVTDVSPEAYMSMMREAKENTTK